MLVVRREYVPASDTLRKELPLNKLILGVATLAVAASTLAPASAAVRFTANSLPAQRSLPSYDDAAKKAMPLLYVGDNANNQISVFKVAAGVKSPAPFEVIKSGLYGPQGLTTDKAGNLYVANLYGNNVTIYGAGATSPKATLTSNISSPTDVKVDAFGNIYVANSPGFGAHSFILEFPAGSTSPSSVWYTPQTNQVLSGITLLNPTMQGSTSIYAASYTLNGSGFAQGSVLSCYPGNSTCATTLSNFGQTGGITVAQSPGGKKPFQFLMVDQYIPGVDVFTSQQESGQVVTGGTPAFIALNAARKDLFVADAFYGRVSEYTWPAHKLVNQFNPARGSDTPLIIGVAVSPAGTYF
jgi:hypothetical protein